MRLFVAFLILCSVPYLFGEDKLDPHTPKPLTELQKSKIEVKKLEFDNAQLTQQVAKLMEQLSQVKQQDTQRDYGLLVQSICDELKIPRAKCMVDPAAGTATLAQDPPPAKKEPAK